MSLFKRLHNFSARRNIWDIFKSPPHYSKRCQDPWGTSFYINTVHGGWRTNQPMGLHWPSTREAVRIICILRPLKISWFLQPFKCCVPVSVTKLTPTSNVRPGFPDWCLLRNLPSAELSHYIATKKGKRLKDFFFFYNLSTQIVSISGKIWFLHLFHRTRWERKIKSQI